MAFEVCIEFFNRIVQITWYILLVQSANMQSAGQSAKERQAKRRAKVKKDDQLYQAHLKRDRKRKEKARAEAKKAMSSFQLEEYHVKERQRVRQYRAKKISCQEEDGETAAESSYSLPHCAGKGESY